MDFCLRSLPRWIALIYEYSSSIVSVLVALAAIWCACRALLRKSNKWSKDNIVKLKRNGKYIESLYAEVDCSAEELRYFLYGDKWRHRVAESWNSHFRRGAGLALKNNVGGAIDIKRSFSFNVIIEHIEKWAAIYKKPDNLNLPASTGDLPTLIEMDGQFKKFEFQQLISFCTAALSQSIVVVGAAGTGKTNLLCWFTEFAIRTKNACIFVESRQLREDCVDCFFDKIYCPSFVSRTLYIRIIELTLAVLRKKLFVVIDAINENDSSTFASSLYALHSLLQKYPRIRLLYSCREEFFSERMERFFGSTADRIQTVKVGSVRNDSQLKEYMFFRYKEYFKFEGELSEKVAVKLCSSFILMRIFFETYQGTNFNVHDLHDAKLYGQYLKQAGGVEPHVFDCVLDKLIQAMVQKMDFDVVSTSSLNLSTEEEELLKKLIDNSLVLSEKVEKDKNLLTERIAEVLYFPFDELRDYCLARYFLLKCVDTYDYDIFYAFLKQLYEKQNSPLEGVIKFSYLLFREKKQLKVCQELLEGYCDSKNMNYFWNDHVDNYYSLGMSVLAHCLVDLFPFEKTYIIRETQKDPLCFWQLVNYLLLNECLGGEAGLSMLFDIFGEAGDYFEIKCRLSTLEVGSFTNLNTLKAMLKAGKIKESKDIKKFFLIFNSLYQPSDGVLSDNYKLIKRRA